jgi:hypothetical protein
MFLEKHCCNDCGEVLKKMAGLGESKAKMFINARLLFPCISDGL